MADFRNLAPFPKLPQIRIGSKGITFIIGLIVVVLIILDGLVSVPPGHVGIIYDRGRGVLADELPEGLHLKIPFWQVSYLTDVRTQEYTMSVAAGEGAVYSDDSMTAPTSDGQTVWVDATVLFHVDRTMAAELFQEVGPDYVQKIVRPIARSQIRSQIAKYTAIDVYAKKRDDAEKQIDARIKELYAEKDIVLEKLLLRHIAFSDQYALAIEEKQVAEQRIQKAEYQKLEAAELKQKIIIEAEAEAEAIKLKGEMLRANPQVIQFEFVQKMSPNITWGIMPDNVLPLLNLGM
ncbi:prohibitin family protein [Patescibacteria group bacterium]|nr:prohibitin family protein [Patescibacteria group bacterium]MBU1015824.1 prohibitin family protein [Patescibacteria group bacterium]MBU1685270.1 prohibitin family protein [Patescibacteria group bacterium]MBU1938467.1 prohibitin family protein [Patescibacteria group bacterium]